LRSASSQGSPPNANAESSATRESATRQNGKPPGSTAPRWYSCALTELGSGFVGSAPLMSRIVVNSVQTGSTMLYVIRESFR